MKRTHFSPFHLCIALSATCILFPSTATGTGSLSFVYEDIYARPYFQVFLQGDLLVKEADDLPLLEKKNEQAAEKRTNEKKDTLIESQSEQAQQNSRTDTILMRSEANGCFLCTVPRLAPAESSPETLLTEKETLRKGLERGTELLASMKCIYHMNGWFTYEYCHGRHVRQFHRPPSKSGQEDGAERPPLFEYFLGRNTQSKYSKGSAAKSPKSRNNHKQMDKDNEIEKTEDGDGKELAQVGLENGTIYISFHYKDGTLCDITGKPRSAKVQFFCNQQQPEHISQILEPSICNYVISIQTPRLCNDPAFVSRSANPINCNPII